MKEYVARRRPPKTLTSYTAIKRVKEAKTTPSSHGPWCLKTNRNTSLIMVPTNLRALLPRNHVAIIFIIYYFYCCCYYPTELLKCSILPYSSSSSAAHTSYTAAGDTPPPLSYHIIDNRYLPISSPHRL